MHFFGENIDGKNLPKIKINKGKFCSIQKLLWIKIVTKGQTFNNFKNFKNEI